MNDDLIQKLLDENGRIPDSASEDVKAYQRLFDLLDKTDAYKPSPGFAHRVTASLDKQRSSSIKNLIVPVLFGFFALSIVLVGLILYMQISIPFSGFTPTLLWMTLLTLIITGVYQLIEQKTMPGRELGE